MSSATGHSPGDARYEGAPKGRKYWWLEVHASREASEFVAVRGDGRDKPQAVLVTPAGHDVFEQIDLHSTDFVEVTPDGKSVIFGCSERHRGPVKSPPTLRCYDTASGLLRWKRSKPSTISALVCASNEVVWHQTAAETARQRIVTVDIATGVDRLEIEQIDESFACQEGLACFTTFTRTRALCNVVEQSSGQVVQRFDTSPHRLVMGMMAHGHLIGADGEHLGLHCYGPGRRLWTHPAPSPGDPCWHLNLADGRVYYTTRGGMDNGDDHLMVQELDGSTGQRLRQLRLDIDLGWHPFHRGSQAMSRIGVLDYAELRVRPHDHARIAWL